MTQVFTPNVRRWLLVVGTLAVAFFSGHIMQRNGLERPDPSKSEFTAAIPSAPKLIASLQRPPVFRDRAMTTWKSHAESCDPSLHVSETPAGNIAIDLHAPCHINQSFAIHINQLTADVTTNAFGKWNVRLPKLGKDMRIEASFGEDVLTKRMRLTKPKGQQHVILAWHGPQVFEISTHGAHKDRAERRDRDDRFAQSSAIVTRIGDRLGSSFEILSFPSSAIGSGSMVRLSVQAKVTEGNCDKRVAMLAYQTGYLERLRPTEVSFTMPSCDRVGDVVHLQNLFRDMKLAKR